MKVAAAITVLPFPGSRLVARAGEFCELTKPRLNTMVLVTTALGFCLAARSGAGEADWARMIHAVLGTFLAAAGAAALNMLIERDADALMQRTQDRPIPSGRVTTREALVFGVSLCVCGLTYLIVAVNALTCLLGAITIVTYLFVYTPLKRRTPLCTVVGAVPGAIPPMMGWSAANGTLDAGAWALFAILFCWQLPHFFAIGWLYRDDYARGGFPMLPVLDATGSRTSWHIAGWTVALIGASLMPVVFGVSAFLYAAGAVLLGVGFMACGIHLVIKRTASAARQLFLASLAYLPLLLSLMLFDS